MEIDLPPETWRVLHSVLMDDAVPRRAAIQAIGALERALNEAGVTTRRPIAVAFFTNEEGARFQPDMMGSLVYVGGIGLDEACAAADKDGSLVGDELRRIGYRAWPYEEGRLALIEKGERRAAVTLRQFLEFHMEPVETSGAPLVLADHLL